MFVDVKKLLAVCTILFAFPACGGDPPVPSTSIQPAAPEPAFASTARQAPQAAPAPVISPEPGAAPATGAMQGGGADRHPAPGMSEEEYRAEETRMIAWEQSFSIEMHRRHEEHLAQHGRGSEESGEKADGYVAMGVH